MKLKVTKDSIYFGGNGYKEGEVFEVNDLIGNELLSKKSNLVVYSEAKKVEPKKVELKEEKPKVKKKKRLFIKKE